MIENNIPCGLLSASFEKSTLAFDAFNWIENGPIKADIKSAVSKSGNRWQQQ